MIATAFTAHRQTSRIAYNHPYPLKSHRPGAVRLTSKTRLTRVTEAVDDVVFLHLVLPDCTVVGKLLAVKVEAETVSMARNGPYARERRGRHLLSVEDLGPEIVCEPGLAVSDTSECQSTLIQPKVVRT